MCVCEHEIYEQITHIQRNIMGSKLVMTMMYSDNDAT